jgi:hypothetical protein
VPSPGASGSRSARATGGAGDRQLLSRRPACRHRRDRRDRRRWRREFHLARGPEGWRSGAVAAGRRLGAAAAMAAALA